MLTEPKHLKAQNLLLTCHSSASVHLETVTIPLVPVEASKRVPITHKETPDFT